MEKIEMNTKSSRKLSHTAGGGVESCCLALSTSLRNHVDHLALCISSRLVGVIENSIPFSEPEGLGKLPTTHAYVRDVKLTCLGGAPRANYIQLPRVTHSIRVVEEFPTLAISINDTLLRGYVLAVFNNNEVRAERIGIETQR